MNKNNLQSFRDLAVWQKAADLAILVYRCTEQFPSSERYGLVSQMRRAVISVSSNIAEGFKRTHAKEKIQLYIIAHSSAAELESQTEIAHRLHFLSQQDYESLIAAIVEVSKMIDGLIKSFFLRRSLNPQSSILNPHHGFTLAEVLVAIAVFSVVVSIAVGGFVRALRTERDIAALIGANSNVSLVIEQMAREIRTGYDFCGSFPNAGCPISGTVDVLVFTNAQNETVTYCRDSAGALVRGVGTASCAGSGFEELTADTVFVGYLHFVLLGNRADDGRTPRITISLGVAPRAARVSEDFVNVQTTVSARTLDS